MQAQCWVASDVAAQLRTIGAFGKVIANADMHKGNVSFVPEASSLRVAPVYDMLPMAYAPLAGGEIPKTVYAPGLPTPRDRNAWLAASRAALAFWKATAADPRICARFRAVCDANLRELERLTALA